MDGLAGTRKWPIRKDRQTAKGMMQ